MGTNLRGELTEAAQTRFEHPTSEQLAPNATIMTVLGHAIASGDVSTFRSVSESEGPRILSHTDYLGNTPLVSTLQL